MLCLAPAPSSRSTSPCKASKRRKKNKRLVRWSIFGWMEMSRMGTSHMIASSFDLHHRFVPVILYQLHVTFVQISYIRYLQKRKWMEMVPTQRMQDWRKIKQKYWHSWFLILPKIVVNWKTTLLLYVTVDDSEFRLHRRKDAEHIHQHVFKVGIGILCINNARG